jgi:putative tryptophan/tyrosine transport system substrate-binding protein
MRAGGPVRGCLLALAALLSASVLTACSDDEPAVENHTIGILRTVAGSTNEQILLDALADQGIDRSHLTIFGEDADEVHLEAAETEATVRDWVSKGVELIIALSTRTAVAAAETAPTTPVIVLSTDPSATGLVRDERHPEGHVTGASYRVPADRTLALANDAFADVDIKRVGCLEPANDPAAVPARAALETGAEALGMELICSTFASPDAVPDAIQEVLAAHVDAIVLVNAPSTAIAIPQLRFVLSKTTVPVIANQPADFAVLTLSPDGNAVYRTMGRQAARILQGTPVADVPVEDPGRYLLVVNLPAAARIGRTVAPEVLKRADEVIRT